MNLPPEIDTSTMHPPFDLRTAFESDDCDSTPTHRIVFTGDKVFAWAIVGHEYGAPTVGKFKTLPEAREMLASGMVCDECGGDFHEESRIITDPDHENREVVGKFCHPDCMGDAFNREAEKDARLNGVWKVGA